MLGRAEIGADQALGGRSFLDLGDQAEAVARPWPRARRESRAAASASRAARSRSSSVASRLAGGDFLALGGADLGELVGHRVVAIQQSSSALARPLSIASAASSTPSVQVVDFARHHQRAGGVEQHRVAIGAGLALQQRAQRGGVVRGVAAADRLDRGVRQAGVGGVDALHRALRRRAPSATSLPPARLSSSSPSSPETTNERSVPSRASASA